MKAVEFFSGIGAFAEAANGFSIAKSSQEFSIEVVAAFDQSEPANTAYEHNFGLKPSSRNLDSIKTSHIPEADLWWMSPPCTPYSVRGKRRDLEDARAVSFINLLEHATLLQPKAILIENVMGFRDSAAEQLIYKKLKPLGYNIRTYELCPTLFGVPMTRSRYFVVASKTDDVSAKIERHPSFAFGTAPKVHTISQFLFEEDPTLFLTPEVMSKYGDGFDIVSHTGAGSIDDPDARLICFTRNYARCMKASGSMIRTKSGVRRISPEEILKLFGFSLKYAFPDEIDRTTRWRLVGNSVDVRAVRYLLEKTLRR